MCEFDALKCDIESNFCFRIYSEIEISEINQLDKNWKNFDENRIIQFLTNFTEIALQPLFKERYINVLHIYRKLMI